MKKILQIVFLCFVSIQLAGQCTGDIVLTSQAEVNAFPSQYGCSIIEGNLYIGKTPWYLSVNISDLSPLSSIVEITGDFTFINPSFGLTDLSGLENLTTVGGDFEISQTDNLPNFDELSNLQSVGGHFRLWDNTDLVDISALGNLQAVGGIEIDNHYNLGNLNGLDNITSLEGDLMISNMGQLSDFSGIQNITNVDGRVRLDNLNGITDLSAFNNLVNVGSRLAIWSNTNLQSLSGLNSGINIGGLSISDNDLLTDLSGLEAIDTLNGASSYSSCVFTENDGLTSLNGIENLTFIENSLFIGENPVLTDLSALSNLQHIGSTITIDDNDALTNLNGLQNITSDSIRIRIEENDALLSISNLPSSSHLIDLRINRNNALLNLNGLENVVSITEDLNILRNQSLVNLNGLNNLQSVGDFLHIWDNNSLVNISALANLNFIGGDFWLVAHDNLMSLSGLENLTEIGGDLSIRLTNLLSNLLPLSNLSQVGGLQFGDNAALSSLEGLSQIDSLTSYLWIYDNPLLTDLLPLQNIQTVGWFLRIHEMSGLTSLEGLNSLNEIGGNLELYQNNTLQNIDALINVSSIGENLSIYDNFSLSECCALLQLSNVTIGEITLYGNATGCNSAIEANNQCTDNTILQGIVLNDDCSDNLVLQTVSGNVYELMIPVGSNINLEAGQLYEVVFPNESLTSDACSGIDFSVVPESANLISYDCSLELTVTPLDENFWYNTPVVSVSYLLDAELADFYTYELTINGTNHPADFVNGDLIVFPDIPPCTYFSTLTNYNVNVLDFFGNIVCSDAQTVSPPYLPVPGVHPDCPVVVTICEGETANINAGMVGAFGPAPDQNPCAGCQYSVSPMTNVECGGYNPGDCFYSYVSPTETTLYTYNYNDNGWNIGVGYILVEVEECGSSSDAGVINLIQGNSFLHNGVQDIEVELQNFDMGLLENVQINWSVNGLLQTPYQYQNAQIAENEVNQITIGSYFFEYNTDYDIEIWTSNPNGTTDTNPNNDAYFSSVYINDIGADPSLVESADLIYIICPGDTVNGLFPIFSYSCGPVGPSTFEFLNWTPQENIDIGNINSRFFSVFPTTNTYFELTGYFEHQECGVLPTYLSASVYVLVESCENNTDLPHLLDLSVWLEGVNETEEGLMQSNLATLQLLPNAQPFNQTPWNYEGTETLPTNTNEIVDWVLVELRTGTPNVSIPNTQVAFQQAGLLLSDGSIVGANKEALSFNGIAEGGSYHVAIRQRNHLDVLSAAPVTFNEGTPSVYDFTTNASQAFGLEQLKEMPNGKYALYAGDFNSDGVIQSTDYDEWAIEPAVVNIYDPTDANLDGVIQTTDYDLWFLNKAKLGVTELQD